MYLDHLSKKELSFSSHWEECQFTGNAMFFHPWIGRIGKILVKVLHRKGDFSKCVESGSYHSFGGNKFWFLPNLNGSHPLTSSLAGEESTCKVVCCGIVCHLRCWKQSKCTSVRGQDKAWNSVQLLLNKSESGAVACGWGVWSSIF